MFEEISKVKGLLTKFGGHPMAAGLSLSPDNIDAFRTALNSCQSLSLEDLTPKTWIDVPMPLDYVSFDLINEFSVLEPFGKGNEKPIFADRNLKVVSARIIGKNRNVLKLQLQTINGRIVDAIKFKAEENDIPELNSNINIIYYPDINEYMGNRKIQFIINEIG